eukprot:33997-Prymnesium_polylepis.1
MGTNAIAVMPIDRMIPPRTLARTHRSSVRVQLYGCTRTPPSSQEPGSKPTACTKRRMTVAWEPTDSRPLWPLGPACASTAPPPRREGGDQGAGAAVCNGHHYTTA